jgi:hypothetical protein
MQPVHVYAVPVKTSQTVTYAYMCDCAEMERSWIQVAHNHDLTTTIPDGKHGGQVGIFLPSIVAGLYISCMHAQ